MVYAADNGANVVQEAFATGKLTAFARAAIDYAYAKDVIVVSRMADENSRNHNTPDQQPHLPGARHRVRRVSDTSSSSFLDFVNCTNFGGHLEVSVSGTACSSEAVGKTSGISGLIHSYGLALGPVAQAHGRGGDAAPEDDGRRRQRPRVWRVPGRPSNT